MSAAPEGWGRFTETTGQMVADPGQASGVYREPETSEDNLFLHRLKRVEASPSGVYSVHIYLSKLRASNWQPHFLNIAVRSFDVLNEKHKATVFPLHDADTVLICRNVLVDDANRAVDKVRALFGEDPLVALEDGGFEDNSSTWYNLSQPVAVPVPDDDIGPAHADQDRRDIHIQRHQF